MRRILCVLAVPVLVAALLLAPSSEAAVGARPALQHPPTCC